MQCRDQLVAAESCVSAGRNAAWASPHDATKPFIRRSPPPDCPQAIHDLPVRKLLDPAALKHVAHAADRVDETAAGTAASGHGARMGILAHERKDLASSFPEGPGPSKS